MNNTLDFVYAGQRYTIALDHAGAPNTLAQLQEHLPVRIDLHCAKIAGRHIFWHAPFIAELERGQDVLSVPPGTLLYWPERQFLELTYGPLQEEAAQITVLGRLTGPIDWLIDLGEELRREQGSRIFWAELEYANGDMPVEAPLEPTCGDARLAALYAARVAVWASEPDSVKELLDRRGILQPYGPLAMAEGEFRKLQELLWRYLSQHASGFTQSNIATASAFLVDAFRSRIVGLCGMHACADILDQSTALLCERPDLVEPTLKELVLYAGRMAGWLDLHIPWNQLNSIMVQTRDSNEPASVVTLPKNGGVQP